jgi:hypothetical protein
MIGRNALIFNLETMVEVVQQWVDREFKNPPKVASVIPTSENSQTVFRVSTVEKEKEDLKKCDS